MCKKFIDKHKQKSLYGEYVPVSGEELAKAIIRLLQGEAFQTEFQNLSMKNDKPNKHVKKSSKLYKLDPCFDSDGLVRVGGRLQRSDFDVYIKLNILLLCLKKSSKLYKLDPCFYSDGLVRVGGRLQRSDFDVYIKLNILSLCQKTVITLN